MNYVALALLAYGVAAAQQVPQLLILKVSNDIQLEADLVLVLAP